MHAQRRRVETHRQPATGTIERLEHREVATTGTTEHLHASQTNDPHFAPRTPHLQSRMCSCIQTHLTNFDGVPMTASESPTAMTTGISEVRLSGLQRWNMGLAVLHLGQAVLILLLTSDFAIAVITSFPDGPPGTAGLATSTLFDPRIGWAVGLFLGLAGFDHLLTATFLRDVYERDLQRGINRFRWIEYSVSATIMVIVISLYRGITTINALILIAGANVAMILFGCL